MAPLKPIKTAFFPGPFNYKMIQSLLRGFHSVGKASKITFLLFFNQMMPFFQVWSIKQILELLLFSALAHYTASRINYATIFVWVCWYGCQSVVGMCVFKNIYACACVCL